MIPFNKESVLQAISSTKKRMADWDKPVVPKDKNTALFDPTLEILLQAAQRYLEMLQ